MTHKSYISLATVAFASLVGSQAIAQDVYEYDESCAPTTIHQTEQGIPDVLMITDRSGSMNGRVNGKTKLQIAREAITELARSAHKDGPCNGSVGSGCDDVRLGLGWFSNSASVDVKPAENSRDSVISTINRYNTTGATALGQASRVIYQSQELRGAERVGAGVLLTDGEPWTGNSTLTTVEQSLYYLCKAREDYGIQTFMVGFGAGSDPRMNSLLAAAGGTGECCRNVGNTTCTYQTSERFDPCQLNRRGTTDRLNAKDGSATIVNGRWNNKLVSNVQCKGALQADTGQALKDELLGLLGQISCTFPLDVPSDYLRFPGADADPNATRVEFDHAILGQNIRITPKDAANPNAFYNYLVNQRGVSPAIASPYKGEGWTFANTQRTTVTLTPKLCNEVRSDNVQTTETQLACLCENTGEFCNVLCDDGDGDKYDDTTGAFCEEDRETGELYQAGRCRPGIVGCSIGEEYCAPQFSVQPDICNGLDDDCDGMVDNTSRAAPSNSSSREVFQWNQNESQLESEDFDKGLFCGFRDLSCSCGASGPQDIQGQLGDNSPDPDYEWKKLLSTTAAQRKDRLGMQKDICSCNSGLGFEDEPVIAAEQDDSVETDSSHEAAACNAASSSPASPASLLLFLGFFAFLFRRKNRD